MKNHRGPSVTKIGFISQKILMKSFSKNPFPHEFVNLFLLSVMIKTKVDGFVRELTIAKLLYKYSL